MRSDPTTAGASLATLASATLMLLLSAPATWAATKTWSGATDGIWSKGGNWVGGTKPLAGDSLVFPLAPVNKSMTNDLGNAFSVAAMSFDGNYSIAGNSIALGSAGISCPGTGTSSISAAVDLAAAVVITVANNCVVQLTGTVSGAFDITKMGGGVFRLTGTNTYSKKLIINDGYVSVLSAGGLGAGDGTEATGTVVNTGGTLQIGANVANEAITVFGQGDNNNGVVQAQLGTFSLGGPVTLGDGNVTMAVLANRELIFNGPVGGSGRFGITGGGVFTLANTANSFSGPMALGSAILKLGASDVIPDATVLAFTTGSGAFDLNNFRETIAGITGSVNVLTRTSSVLTIDQNVDSSFSGRFYGDGIVVKTGIGKLTLPFEHFITGVISCFAGTLIIDGNFPGGATVAPGGVLGGSGTIVEGVFGTGGTVSPGSSPGILETGPLSLSAASTLSIEIAGVAAGSGYDQIAVTGAVSLGGSALNVNLGFSPATGTTFTIIGNDGTDAVSGTFADLPQGAIVIANGTPFVISYTGGTGNDVVLTANAPLPRTLDVDLNGAYDALTDGVLIVRYLAGTTGTSLTTRALGSSATRTDPAAIKTYLDSVRAALDVDGNGQPDAFTDGLMILRYMFGLRGSPLVAGALGAAPSRSTSAQVAPYIQQLMP